MMPPAIASLSCRARKKAETPGNATRVCAFANWPGQLEPRKSQAFIHAADCKQILARMARLFSILKSALADGGRVS